MWRKTAKQIGIRLAVLLITAYQSLLRPFLIGHCKFYPTCSHYTAEAIEKWGLCRGLSMGLKRISRCHPFGPGGIDPVQ